MRDIRDDLKERLSSLEERVTQLQESLKVIEDESSVIMRLLDYEDHRFPTEPGTAGDAHFEAPVLTGLLDKQFNGRTVEASSGSLFQ